MFGGGAGLSIREAQIYIKKNSKWKILHFVGGVSSLNWGGGLYPPRGGV